ncbi:hypothetical protein BT96DRAFT_395443 [Gymnopus androsaceus JB14]|uniref:F-box domain-containing protein n=1 Tax=Gymnopus androsaceus JB14 TaxID=1447944 RepID=A0A6A4I5X6_9AGAR|nr:hypothetical protein BT96DRAFT_395443 [Gymnopus androsaceus JB14]
MEKLRSLCHVSDTEASSLFALIGEVDSDLSRYDMEITRLRDALETLESQRASLKLYRDHNEALVSPIRKLPIEIIQDIFSFVCGDSSYSLQLKADSVSTPALDLAQVSHVWRNAANSMVSLWCNLYVNLVRDEEIGVLEVYESRYIETDAPLDLCIVALDATHEQYDGISWDSDGIALIGSKWKLWSSIVRQSHRWRNITLKGPWSFFCDMSDNTDYNDMPNGGFPMLESLRLQWDPDIHMAQDRHDGPEFLMRFHDAPRLRSLSVPEYHYWYSFPFDQLTSFGSFDGWPCRDIIHFLERSPRIRSLSMHSYVKHSNPDDGLHQLKAPLTSVNVSQYFGYNESINLLKCLILIGLDFASCAQ